MKKKLVVLSLVTLLGLTACGEDPKPDPKPDTPNTEDVTKPEVVLKDFEGLTLNDLEVTYDGQIHSLEVGNLIEGATVIYTNNDKKDVGTYEVSATVSKEGYNDKTLTASLKIIPADIKGLTFESESIEFDSHPHTVSITGNLPEGAVVKYSCKEDPNVTNTVTNPGVYTIVATVTCDNYNPVSMEATIKVVSKDVERFITKHNGKVYFQNALDNDKLYTFDPINKVQKVNNSKAQYFTTYKDKLYYRSDSIVPSIVSLEVNNKVNTIYGDNAEYIIDDEQYIYYADNSLVGDNGIYRLTIGTDEVICDKLYDGKAYYLQLVGNDIYFADGKNGKKLSKVSKSIVNQTSATLVLDEKINNLITNGTNLFFTVNNLVGDYIAKYDLMRNEAIKLTSDAGKYLTLDGNNLYYVNVDKVSSNLLGKGIYRVSTTATKDNNLPGSLAIKEEYKDFPISSLTVENGSLYFYQTYDKKLYSYNLSTEKLTDTLEGFVAPEDVNILAKQGAVTPYKNKVYYQNQYDSNCLYVYDTDTNTNVKVTSSAVDDLYIYKDYLYYRQVSFFVNKDLYRINVKEGGEPQLISKEDCGELEISNDKIYYTNYSGNNEIHMMDLDGKNDVVLYDKEAYNLRVYGNRLYFVVNTFGRNTGYINYIDLTSENKTPVELKNFRTSYFEIKDDVIYFRLVEGTKKRLASTDLEGKTVTDIYAINCDPNSFVIVDDVVYYNNDVTTQYGVESFNLTTKEHKVIKKDVFAYNLQYVNGKLYYQSYCFGGTLGDGHFYELSLDGSLNRIA